MKTIIKLTLVVVSSLFFSHQISAKNLYFPCIHALDSPDLSAPVVDESPIVSEFDQPATYNGKESMGEFISNNLNFPSHTGCSGGSHKVEIIFVVDTFGNVSNVKVNKSSGCDAYDKEAIRVVKKLNGRMNPAQINHKKVKAYCKIPIIFELVDE